MSIKQPTDEDRALLGSWLAVQTVLRAGERATRLEEQEMPMAVAKELARADEALAAVAELCVLLGAITESDLAKVRALIANGENAKGENFNDSDGQALILAVLSGD